MFDELNKIYIPNFLKIAQNIFYILSLLFFPIMYSISIIKIIMRFMTYDLLGMNTHSFLFIYEYHFRSPQLSIGNWVSNKRGLDGDNSYFKFIIKFRQRKSYIFELHFIQLFNADPSITDGVHRNENFVEIIPVFSTFWNFFKKKKKIDKSHFM